MNWEIKIISTVLLLFILNSFIKSEYKNFISKRHIVYQYKEIENDSNKHNLNTFGLFYKMSRHIVNTKPYDSNSFSYSPVFELFKIKQNKNNKLTKNITNKMTMKDNPELIIYQDCQNVISTNSMNYKILESKYNYFVNQNIWL